MGGQRANLGGGPFASVLGPLGAPRLSRRGRAMKRAGGRPKMNAGFVYTEKRPYICTLKCEERGAPRLFRAGAQGGEAVSGRA